ncbi:MAG: hypothetical protein IKG86_05725 [Paludibacteraceae bacterium]|nr:hypothetical protein [Paludibacteraceae bacterium]
MSKGNMLLGHARGKVGDLVFARVNGQQVTRARAAVVSNPRTQAQMIQRIILNTVIQAYSRMAEICDHSFEGVPTGSKSMNKFMRENVNALRQKVANWVNSEGTFSGVYAFAPKGLNSFVPNDWVLSKGQLPEIVLESVSATAGATIAITSAAAIPTYGEIIASLGLQRGDQLTFIGQELYTDGRAAFKFARVILDPRESDGTQAELTTPFLNGGSVNKPSSRNEGSDIVFSSTANSLTFDLGANSQFGAAVIVSRQKSDDTWLRSNAAIQLAESIPYALVGAYDMEEALEYTMSGGIDLESERYLNNAVRGRKIVAPTPDPDPEPEPEPTPTPGTGYTLTINGSESGLVVSVDGNPITSGASVEAGKTVSVDSSAVSGRDIDSATLNGDPISGADAGVFTFTMPSQNSVLLIEWIDN